MRGGGGGEEREVKKETNKRINPGGSSFMCKALLAVRRCYDQLINFHI